MRFSIGLIALTVAAAAFAQTVLAQTALAQDAAKPDAPKSVTVPITLDHNRVVIDVYLPLPDGTTKRIRGWVDNGNPDFEMSRRAATLLGLNVTCDDKTCSAPPPPNIRLAAPTGAFNVALADLKEVKIPLKPVNAATVMVPGMSAEINLPASVLQHYDVLIDFPDREFTIAQPGTLKFKGVSSKAIINVENGLIVIPSQIENKKYNLGLDVGSSISFLSQAISDKLLAADANLPHMTGAIGHANLWGADEEPKWRLLRLDRVQFGPLFLTGVATVGLPKDKMDWFEKRAGSPMAGILGTNALLNYRIGIDYARSMVYFDIGSTFRAPDFDVVGLTLRPEDDGRFMVVGVADFNGQSSVPGVQAGDYLVSVDGVPVTDSTMGQIWSMLEGTPGQERKLVLERDGKKFDIVAHVQHFLGEPPEETDKKGKKK